MNFWKSAKGGWSFSIQKFILQTLGTFNRAFWSWNWYKIVISGFRVCFFQQLYCITIVLHLYLEIMCMHFILSSHHISSHICNHMSHKRFAIKFSKNEERGSKTVWIFFLQKIIRFGSAILPSEDRHWEAEFLLIKFIYQVHKGPKSSNIVERKENRKR